MNAFYLYRQLHRACLSWQVRSDQGLNFDAILALAVSPDGNRLATARPGDEVKPWSHADGKVVRTISPPAKDKNGAPRANIRGLFFAGEGRQLVAVARHAFDRRKLDRLRAEVFAGQGTVRLESITKTLECRSWTLAGDGPAPVEPFDPRRLQTPVSTLLSGGVFAADGGHMLNIMLLDRSPDGKSLVLAGADTDVATIAVGQARQAGKVHTGRLIVWDPEQNQLRVQQNSPVVLTAAAFSPNGDSVATATVDGAVGLRQPDLAQPPQVMLGHHGFVYALRFSSDGRRLVSGGVEQRLGSHRGRNPTFPRSWSLCNSSSKKGVGKSSTSGAAPFARARACLRAKNTCRSPRCSSRRAKRSSPPRS